MIALAWAIVRKLPWRWIGLAAAVLGLLWAVDAHGRHTEAAKWRPRLEASQAALRKASDALQAASQAIRNRDVALLENAAGERLDATQLASVMKGSARAAFDAGYAARRCSPGEPVGVRDLRALQAAGAFSGSAGVPGKP